MISPERNVSVSSEKLYPETCFVSIGKFEEAIAVASPICTPSINHFPFTHIESHLFVLLRVKSAILRSSIPGEKSSKNLHLSRNPASFTVLRIYAITSRVPYTNGNPSISSIIWKEVLSNPGSRSTHHARWSFSLSISRISGKVGYTFPAFSTEENPVPTRSVVSPVLISIRGSFTSWGESMTSLRRSADIGGRYVDFIEATRVRRLIASEICAGGIIGLEDFCTGRGECSRIVDTLSRGRSQWLGHVFCIGRDERELGGTVRVSWDGKLWGADWLPKVISSVSPKIFHIKKMRKRGHKSSRIKDFYEQTSIYRLWRFDRQISRNWYFTEN